MNTATRTRLIGTVPFDPTTGTEKTEFAYAHA